MDEFKDHATAVIADVDCTADGQSLCSTHGVRGYPSIKYGDPGDLKDYNGARSFDELKKFASENLGPTCGPEHLDLCDEATKAKVEKFMAMTEDRLEGKIRNAIRVVEEEVPIMKKVMAHLKKKSDGKGGEL